MIQKGDQLGRFTCTGVTNFMPIDYIASYGYVHIDDEGNVVDAKDVEWLAGIGLPNFAINWP